MGICLAAKWPGNNPGLAAVVRAIHGGLPSSPFYSAD
jgi:hypothetical protein